MGSGPFVTWCGREMATPQLPKTSGLKLKRGKSQHCGARNCRNSRQYTPDLSFFRFPRDPERSEKWVNNSHRYDLLARTVEQRHSAVVFCSNHFEDSQFMNPANRNRLTWNAVPSVFNLSDPPPKSTSSKKHRKQRTDHKQIESKTTDNLQEPNLDGHTCTPTDTKAVSAVTKGPATLQRKPVLLIKVDSLIKTVPRQDKAVSQQTEITVNMAATQMKQPLMQESEHNGKSLAQHQSNKAAPANGKSLNMSRKEKRKQYWDKKNQRHKADAGKQSKAEVQAAITNTPVEKEEIGEQDSDSESPRSKLRNREAIAKPDSLKYEPDYKGFHSKLMENLHVEPSKKKKKKKDKKPAEHTEHTPERAAKRKAVTSISGSPPDDAKKAKPAAESEVFDSYKFSLNLINGEVDTSQSPVGKDSKNKYVLFIGNLPYDITREQLEEHFRKTGGIKAIRIPREKGSDKGRGFAYMEFDSRISHGIALRLHQTTLGGRKINVEFTSIGGGKSKARKEKLQMKNKKRRKIKMQY